MISKELLSEILKCTVCYDIHDMSVSYVKLDVVDKGTLKINIHELAHKCKEWALNQKCYITVDHKFTKYAYVKWYVKYDGYCRFGYKHEHEYSERFDAPTEPEAIFKACQWILDNKDK